MHGDEGDLEAANEEPRREEHVTAVRERPAQRRKQRQIGHALLRAAAAAGGAERDRQHEDERQRGGEEEQGGMPAIAGDERLAEGREDELPERTRRRGDAERPRTLLRRHDTAEHRHDQRKARHGDAETHQHAAAEVQHRRGSGIRHQHDACGVDACARHHHASGAEFVGHHADERLAETPDEVLDRHGEAVGFAAPAVRLGVGRGEHAHGGAHAERNRGDEAAGDDHHRHGVDEGA